jgi:hypothetical protein
MPNPTPKRQRVLDFVSPKVADILFFETVDTSLLNFSGFPDYQTPHPDTVKYPNHFLCFIAKGDEEGILQRYYYAAERANQDDYNFEHTKTSIGGEKYDTITRTYIIPRDDYDPDDPETGTVMPDTPAGKFTASDYVLLTKSQKRISQELDSVFVVEQRVYMKRVILFAPSYDDKVGGAIISKSQLYYRGEIFTGVITIEDAVQDPQYWVPTTTGQLKQAVQVSEDWFLVTTADLIPQGLGTIGALGVKLRQYTTWEDFSWPAVLDNGSLIMVDIPRKNGTSNTSVRVIPEKDAFRGPCKVIVYEYWKSTLPTLTAPDVIRAKDISFSGPYYSLSLNNVLHPGLTLISNTGTQDPVFKLGSYGQSYPASSPTTWPEYLDALVTVTPFRGGYLTRTKRVYSPA